MKKIHIGLFLFFGVTFLNGCEEKEPTQTIEYYIKHKDERMNVIHECKAKPKNLQNCENASKANMRVGNNTPRF
ncbi:EexN family lipoprotein [Enterobacter asburiae]|uniref:EexN family lipoprotein n=1 Tax=Enterobacter asburiae TaxID=61645 RepID=UPI000FD6FDB1|nr:EexN family lipoprotein [Enterobacter asburiae]